MININQHAQLWLRGGFTNFCPSLPGTAILPISTFQVTRIRGISHWHPALGENLMSNLSAREQKTLHFYSSNPKSLSLFNGWVSHHAEYQCGSRILFVTWTQIQVHNLLEEEVESESHKLSYWGRLWATPSQRGKPQVLYISRVL
jgi:hypothetical protein